MQRHADGCGDLWTKQTNTISTFVPIATTSATVTVQVTSPTTLGPYSTSGLSTFDVTDKKIIQQVPIHKNKPNDWVVIPVFADIVRLAIQSREECLTK